MSLQALYTASTGMQAQEMRMSNIANNLSNLNTTGFKASRESFEDLMYEQVKTPGTKNGANTTAPVGIQLGNGTRTAGIYKNFVQGDFVQSGKELDVAIEGQGFIQVTLDNGEIAYTRDGSLRLNQDGALVNNEGLLVTPNITVPSTATSLTIGKDGTVTASEAGAAAPTDLGTLSLVLFQNPAGLKSIGRNLYQETSASGSPSTVNPGQSGAGTLVQGFLENSNVNVAEELISMIVAQRSYEANSKVMSTANEMMRASNNIV